MNELYFKRSLLFVTEITCSTLDRVNGFLSIKDKRLSQQRFAKFFFCENALCQKKHCENQEALVNS